MRKFKSPVARGFFVVFLLVCFVAVWYHESGWKTVVIKDVTKPQAIKLNSLFTFFPLGIEVYAVGWMKGDFSFQYGDSLSNLGAAQVKSVDGTFLCDIKGGDWYRKFYLYYVPTKISDVNPVLKGHKGNIRVHYKFRSVWTIFPLNPN